MDETILEEAKRLVWGERQEDYGSVTDDFTRIGKIWEQILGVEVEPMKVALCMIALKISRQVNKNKRDNIVDIAGYAATIEKLDLERENPRYNYNIETRSWVKDETGIS